MPRAIATDQSMSADAQERLAFADAALALAGHEVTDSVLHEILARQARHELTGDEARAAIYQDCYEWAGVPRVGPEGRMTKDGPQRSARGRAQQGHQT